MGGNCATDLNKLARCHQRALETTPKRQRSCLSGFCLQIITTSPRFFREAVILRWLIAFVTPKMKGKKIA